MRTAVLALTLASSACSLALPPEPPDIPGWQGVHVSVDGCASPPSALAQGAVFYAVAAHFADERVETAFHERVTVRYVDKATRAVNGLMHFPQSPTLPYRLVVGCDGDERSALARLAHELVHVGYDVTTGDGDANHEEAPGPWTKADNEIERRVATSAMCFGE